MPVPEFRLNFVVQSLNLNPQNFFSTHSYVLTLLYEKSWDRTTPKSTLEFKVAQFFRSFAGHLHFWILSKFSSSTHPFVTDEALWSFGVDGLLLFKVQQKYQQNLPYHGALLHNT